MLDPNKIGYGRWCSSLNRLYHSKGKSEINLTLKKMELTWIYKGGGYELEGDVIVPQLDPSIHHRCYEITTVEQIFLHHNSRPLYFITPWSHIVVGSVCVKGGESGNWRQIRGNLHSSERVSELNVQLKRTEGKGKDHSKSLHSLLWSFPPKGETCL